MGVFLIFSQSYSFLTLGHKHLLGNIWITQQGTASEEAIYNSEAELATVHNAKGGSAIFSSP